MHHTQTCYALTALKCHELTQKWPWSKTFMKKGTLEVVFIIITKQKKKTEKTNRNNSALNMYHGSKRRKVHHRLALRPQMINLLLQTEIKQRQRILFFLMIESKILRNPLLIDNLLTHEFVTVKKKNNFQWNLSYSSLSSKLRQTVWQCSLKYHRVILLKRSHKKPFFVVPLTFYKYPSRIFTVAFQKSFHHTVKVIQVVMEI